jgi:hypothetical protein
MTVSFARQCLPLLMFMLASFDDQRIRQVPRFEGTSIPDPPRQNEPWTSPRTKLPRFLVSATAALFAQGMADPRGCEYRDVEIGDATVFKTRGFVLPGPASETARFVVSWDGVVYPAVSVGAAADLDKDIGALAASMKQEREPAETKKTEFAGSFRFTRGSSLKNLLFGPGSRPSGVESRSALKVCLLLRLGRADLAELVFAAGTDWTPEDRVRDLTDYQISYLTLATDWAAMIFHRLVTAHAKGDDAIAFDAARRLSTFAKAVEIKAADMGFQRLGTHFGSDEAPSYFPFLRQLPELLADHERRAKEPKRGPIPRSGGDPSARIAALIRDLDQIDEHQMSSPGAARPGNSLLVRELIAEGNPAVEPLLTALETDMRLTRSVSFGRGASLDRFVHPVFEAEAAALEGILGAGKAQIDPRRTNLEGRKDLARSLRGIWTVRRKQ